MLGFFRMLGRAAAVFGEKDWQQLQGVTAMTREAGLATRIVPRATLREPDGLAMSSRNRFLLLSERESALAIPQALRRASETTDPKRAKLWMLEELRDPAIQVEYAVIRDAISLRPIEHGAVAGRALIAARVGATRLIDNAPWPTPDRNPGSSA